MSIGRIDLNPLKVFEAVQEERNLLLAGKRLQGLPSFRPAATVAPSPSTETAT